MKNHAKSCPVVQAIHVTKRFALDGRDMPAVADISFEAFAGELILFLGPSGSGKTTLLTLAAGLIRPSSGKVSLFGEEITSRSARELQEFRSRHMGFVFQNFKLIDPLTVEENVQLPMHFVGEPYRDCRTIARRLLKDLHIEHLARRFPSTLSQGEKQRVAIARAIANSPELIIADEPTASLESAQGTEIIRLLYGYAKNGQACVIVSSHDLRIAELADRVLKLEDGKIAANMP